MATTDLALRVRELISQIASGKCELSLQALEDESDATTQEILTGLLLLHEDLQFERQRAIDREQRLAEGRQALQRDLGNSVRRARQWSSAFQYSGAAMALLRGSVVVEGNESFWRLLSQGDPDSSPRPLDLKQQLVDTPMGLGDAGQSGGPCRSEVSLRTFRGKEIRVLLDLSPVLEGGNERFVTLTDITERVEHERARVVLEDIVTTMPIGLMLAQWERPEDPLGFRFTWANDLAVTVSTLPRSSLVGGRIREDFPELGETPLPAMYARVLQTGVAEDMHAIAYRDKAGVESFYDVRLVPVGQDKSTLAILYHDVSVHVRSAEQLEQLNRELARSNADLDHFAMAASHDLQEPLRTIQNYSALLAEQIEHELGEDSREFLRLLQQGGKRMQDLVRGLLRYAKVTREPAPFEMVDLGELASTVCTDLAGAVQERSASITVGPLPRLIGDPLLLRQLLQNLLGNAIKYVPSSRAPEVSLTARDEDTHWRLVVEDNGDGIAESDRGRVFEMFGRLHERDSSGSGIGLTLCQKIALRHSGDIGVNSSPRGGAAFWVRLPKGKALTEAA